MNRMPHRAGIGRPVRRHRLARGGVNSDTGDRANNMVRRAVMSRQKLTNIGIKIVPIEQVQPPILAPGKQCLPNS